MIIVGQLTHLCSSSVYLTTFPTFDNCVIGSSFIVRYSSNCSMRWRSSNQTASSAGEIRQNDQQSADTAAASPPSWISCPANFEDVSGDVPVTATSAALELENSSSMDMGADDQFNSRPAHVSKKRGRGRDGSASNGANITRSSAAVVIEDEYDDDDDYDDDEDLDDDDDVDDLEDEDDDYDPYDYDPCSGSDHALPDPPVPPVDDESATLSPGSMSPAQESPGSSSTAQQNNENLPWGPQNQQSTCEFTHTITNYSQKRESGCKKAEYSATTVDAYGNRWRLIVYVNGNGRASNHHLSLFLQVSRLANFSSAFHS